MKDVATVWREFWELGEGPTGSIPPLGLETLMKTVGRDSWVGLDASYYAGAVDDVYEAGAELRIKVHGRTFEPKYTYALRNGGWVWVSSDGKDPYAGMTLLEVYEAHRKALAKEFDSKLKKTNEQGRVLESGSGP
jgi:hypothetical protein